MACDERTVCHFDSLLSDVSNSIFRATPETCNWPDQPTQWVLRPAPLTRHGLRSRPYIFQQSQTVHLLQMAFPAYLALNIDFTLPKPADALGIPRLRRTGRQNLLAVGPSVFLCPETRFRYLKIVLRGFSQAFRNVPALRYLK